MWISVWISCGWSVDNYRFSIISTNGYQFNSALIAPILLNIRPSQKMADFFTCRPGGVFDRKSPQTGRKQAQYIHPHLTRRFSHYPSKNSHTPISISMPFPPPQQKAPNRLRFSPIIHSYIEWSCREHRSLLTPYGACYGVCSVSNRPIDTSTFIVL